MWMLMNLTDGTRHHGSLGNVADWVSLRRRGYVRRIVVPTAFYRITKKGRKAFAASAYGRDVAARRLPQ
jgi:hypothetical protein